ncbi:MAG TPA: voltage-gated chloride channel family protein [Candidatus Kapabacteria bacterium]|nr:voltage-gated chloride channel family protein [Candidatus Kapabacteria bacterium]
MYRLVVVGISYNLLAAVCKISRFLLDTRINHLDSIIMSFSWSWKEHLQLGRYIVRWLILVFPVATVIGSLTALFLWSLELVTSTRESTPWLLYLLPIAGLAIGITYHTIGKRIEGGNNLIVDEIHSPDAGVPTRMAPLILISTIITHLFGGSVGREGTAIQIGGSISSFFSSVYRVDRDSARILLLCGIAGGFGAVFGTPIAGAIFAVEVLAIGTIEYDAILPCLMASLIGDLACRLWGIHHTQYILPPNSTNHALGSLLFSIDSILLCKVGLASVVFGLVSVFFAELTHTISDIFKKVVTYPVIRPVIGGVILLAMVYLLGTRDYLGLGVSSAGENGVSIQSAFHETGSTPLSWFWKSLFTAISLGSGFKGGEVTPLFFIGATAGNALSALLNAPVALFAALGFVAVFAGATNTPLACIIMSTELFGSDYLLYFTIACYLSYFFSGHSSIYLSQRIASAKGGLKFRGNQSLRDIRKSRI